MNVALALPKAEFVPATEGVFEYLDGDIYHAAPGVSNSMLRHLARSPAHLQSHLNIRDQSTPAMLFGRIVHHLLLEAERPWDWAIRPSDLDLRSKEGKAWKEAAGDKPIISFDDWLHIEGVVHAIKSHPIASQALSYGQSEVSIFKNFTLGRTALRKARIDFVHPGNALVDIKTVEDARADAFARSVYAMRYFVQAAYYLDIWNDAMPDQRKEAFVFIAVEKQPPFAVSVYNLAREAINKGRGEYIRLLQLYMECQGVNEWPGYSPDVQELDLPAWVNRKELAA